MPITRWPQAALIALAWLGLAACAGLAPPIDAPAKEAPAIDARAKEALAPTGTLRVALYPGSPTSLVRDSVSGELKGVGLDLGRAMAERLGVAFERVEFPNNAQVLEAVKTAGADFAFTNATAARAKDMDFSPPVLGVEQGYLVARGSTLTIDAVDRPGIRVGVTKASSTERALAKELKAATMIAVPTIKAGGEMLVAGTLDAFATNKAILFEMSDGLPGTRVLEGRYGLESFAIAVPKGREAGGAWLRQFVEDAKSAGVVKRAVDRAGLRGTVEAANP